MIVPEGTVANVGDVLVEIDAPGHEDNEGDSGVAAESQTPAKPAAEPTVDTESAGSSSEGVFQFKLPDIGKESQKANRQMVRQTRRYDQ